MVPAALEFRKKVDANKAKRSKRCVKVHNRGSIFLDTGRLESKHLAHDQRAALKGALLAGE